jgi:hypothetical protein
VSAIPEPVPTLFGERVKFKACDHEEHVCDNVCDYCGCCEHCKDNCGCAVADLPTGISCPDWNCGCEGWAGSLSPHPPRRERASDCSLCDDAGLVGGDLS